MTDIPETAQVVPKASSRMHKPVLCSFMGFVDVSEGVRHLQENGIPNYTFPETAVRAFASMVRFTQVLSPQKGETSGDTGRHKGSNSTNPCKA